MASAIFGGLLAILAGFLALKPVGWELTSLSYDLPFFVHGAGASKEVCIVYLDEVKGETLNRKVQAKLLDRLRENGAKAVAYDLIFDRVWPDPKVDQEFATAVRAFQEREGHQVFFALGRKSYRDVGANVEQLIVPNDVLLDVMTGYGLVAYEEDVFQARNLTTGTPDEASLCWSVASAMNPSLKKEDRLNKRWINFMGYPHRHEGNDAGGSATVPSYLATAVLDGRVSPEVFRDKVVFIGGAPGIVGDALGQDLFLTPHHRLGGKSRVPMMSGVELQATMTANLMNGNWLVRTTQRTECWIIILCGLLLGAGYVWLRPVRGVLFSLILMVLLFVIGVLTIHYGGVWWPWSVVAFAQAPVALVWGTGAHFYVERFFRQKLAEEQRVLREAFGKYVSPQMLDKLTESNFATELGGEKVQVAVMFTDIADFTSICERVGDPEKVVTSLNHYFERTTDQIFKNDGIVIKFIGDAILAGWGAPVVDPDAAKKAVRAAWDLFENARLQMDGEVLNTRVGVHLGDVVAGNIGSSQHIDYTYIGDAVNLASRLEALNKQLGTNILISEECADQLGEEFVLRRVGNFRVKGKEAPTGVVELLGRRGHEARATWIDKYEEALVLFEQGELEISQGILKEIDAMRPEGDGPSQFLVSRIKQDKTGGIIVLAEK